MGSVLNAERSITEREYRQRAESVQQLAAGLDLAAIVAYSFTRAAMWNQTGHTGYITGWSNLDRHSDCAVVVPVRGDPVLLFTGLPALVPLIEKVSWLSDIRIVASPDPGSVSVSFVDPRSAVEPANSYGGTTKRLLAERGLADRPIGLVDVTGVPYGVYRSFQRTFGDLLRVDVPDPIAQLRARKSPGEIALHRKAAALADLGFDVLARRAKPGRWGHQVVAEVEAAVRAEGADYVHFWMCSCPADRWDGLLDLRPHDRELQDGDQVGACAYVTYAGYWVQAMRSGSIGRPCRALEEAVDVGSRMTTAAMGAARPGLPAVGVVDACAAVAEETGFRLTAPRIGHGQGLDYSERPFLVAGSADTFQASNVVVIHPQINDRESAAMRVPVGDCCLVAEHGAEALTKFPRAPFLVT